MHKIEALVLTVGRSKTNWIPLTSLTGVFQYGVIDNNRFSLVFPNKQIKAHVKFLLERHIRSGNGFAMLGGDKAVPYKLVMEDWNPAVPFAGFHAQERPFANFQFDPVEIPDNVLHIVPDIAYLHQTERGQQLIEEGAEVLVWSARDRYKRPPYDKVFVTRECQEFDGFSEWLASLPLSTKYTDAVIYV